MSPHTPMVLVNADAHVEGERMIGTFPGKLALVEGDEVDVDLEIAGGRLRLTTGVSEIGAWPLEACLVTSLPNGGYELTLDGERVAFSPDHPDAFSAVVARMVPVEMPIPATDGYDLEAALDQVLGGSGGYEVPGLAEESADEIAVTLEALFATAYPDFDEDVEDESPSDVPDVLDDDVTMVPVEQMDAVPLPVSGLEDLEPVPPVSDELPVEVAPVEVAPVEVAPVEVAPVEVAPVEVAPVEALAAEVAPVELPPVEAPAAEAPLEVVADFDGGQVEPAAGSDPVGIDVSGWAAAEPEMADWSPAPETVDAETVDTPAVPLDDEWDRSKLGARWRPGHETDEDEIAASVGHDDHNTADDTADDTDDDTDDDADGIPGWNRPIGYPPPSGTGRRRISDRIDTHVDDASPDGASYPRRGYLQDSEFDINAAAASAGYTIPGDPIEADEAAERIPARRGIGGMFSKSAGERFSAVAGAMRDRPGVDVEGDDEELSVADQIIASQEQLRSGSKVVRFTPALVKRIAIVTLIVFAFGGLILVSPNVIAFLVDRVESSAQETPTATTIPRVVTTLPVVPSTVPPPVESTTTTAPAPAEPVFELSAADFVRRWNSTAAQVSVALEMDIVPSNGPLAEGFTLYTGLEGSIGDDGVIDFYTLVMDPRGDPQDDQLGIQALGVAINVAEPAATGSDLRSILLQMGLDVTNPSVEELGGTLIRGDVGYSLTYNDVLIRLWVGPADELESQAVDEEE